MLVKETVSIPTRPVRKMAHKTRGPRRFRFSIKKLKKRFPQLCPESGTKAWEFNVRVMKKGQLHSTTALKDHKMIIAKTISGEGGHDAAVQRLEASYLPLAVPVTNEKEK